MPHPKKHPDHDRLARALGHAIRIARRRKSIKRDNLAYEMGVTPQTVSNWENGRVIPYTPHLLIVCSMLGIRMSQLYAAAERVVDMQAVLAASSQRMKEQAAAERRLDD